MAIMVYSMMVALGEMAALYPVSGAFTHYCARFVDPALGFATGLNYWCKSLASHVSAKVPG
jgi:amino acid transporter